MGIKPRASSTEYLLALSVYKIFEAKNIKSEWGLMGTSNQWKLDLNILWLKYILDSTCQCVSFIRYSPATKYFPRIFIFLNM